MDGLRWVEFYLNPESYIDLMVEGYQIGIYFLIFIAFSEAGLFTGLVFSCDAFLFVAGIYSNNLVNQLFNIPNENWGAVVLACLIAIASIAGNVLAYWYGSKAELYFTNKKDGLFYKRKYLEKSRTFFNRHGVWAIIVSHHIPLVRIFIPLFCAVSGMRFTRFLTLIATSSIIWSFSIILLGHYVYKLLLANYGIDLRQYLWLIVFLIFIIAVFILIFRLISQMFFTSHRGH